VKRKIVKYKTTFICLLIWGVFSYRAQSQTSDTTKKSQLFELSFGQSLLFISNSKLVDLHNKYALVMPTSAFLFFIELRPEKRLKFPLFFNLPTESKQFLVNNQLVYEKASLTCGGGIEYKLFQIKLDSRSKVEVEIGPLISFVSNNNNKIGAAPVIAGRLRITRGENFAMYIGTSYSFGVNTWGLLYGTGTIF
jgi:hypothetical protein